ncbi:hypothetical protein B1L11_29145 [Microbispora sp. GKU 823]|nr:hypothetical protein B1L11_29145 [Microbispora sp. GKU 823]
MVVIRSRTVAGVAPGRARRIRRIGVCWVTGSVRRKTSARLSRPERTAWLSSSLLSGGGAARRSAA